MASGASTRGDVIDGRSYGIGLPWTVRQKSLLVLRKPAFPCFLKVKTDYTLGSLKESQEFVRATGRHSRWDKEPLQR